MNAIVFSAVWGVVMMFAGLFTRRADRIRLTALIGMALLVGVTVMQIRGTELLQVPLEGVLHFDIYSLLFMALVFGATFYFFLLSGSEVEKVGSYSAEYFALLFFICAGISIVAAFSNLLMLFIGIEIITIPLYILAGSDKRNLKSNEASLKYFLMGSFSTGLMLMGIALLYGSRGTFSIESVPVSGKGMTPMLASGLLLLIFSMSFKVSAAPFHFWTPDVYDGSPTVFTAFMATLVKAAAFIAFLRLFQDGFSELHAQWKMIVALITAATLIIGNVTAVFQQSVKRMLAYSSIAQAGFMMLALVALNNNARDGLLFYTTSYSLATLGVFAVLLRMDDYTFEGFNGLSRKEPLLAAVTTVFLLSLAGIPATAGFMGKFYMISATVQRGGFLWLVFLAVLCAAVSVYYYFRVIQAMYFKEAETTSGALQAGTGFKIGLVLLAVVIVVLGVNPQLLLDRLYTIF
ncbi:MAG: hypothetical protein RL732_1536 [Bacteroidota bacterium]|jgi:NADH-quinone oxidoreductase subunit N